MNRIKSSCSDSNKVYESDCYKKKGKMNPVYSVLNNALIIKVCKMNMVRALPHSK